MLQMGLPFFYMKKGSVCRQKGFGIKKFRTPFKIPLKF